MSNVLIFTPKHQLEHENNLQEFIAFCRDLSPLNNEYTFESNYWEKVGNFTIFGANSRQRNPDELLDKSLIPFAKAYIVYGKTTKAAIDVKFKALRAINAICMKEYGQVDVTKLEISDFNGAAEIAKKKLSAEAAHQAGRGLVELLKFLIQHNMLQKITWKNPIKKPATNAVGDDADADRFKKMPDENAIMAIANIAARQTQNLNRRDIFTTSIMNLLLAAPSRGSEPFYLLADCLHKEKMAAKRALDLGLPKEDVELLLRNIFIEKLITKLALPREDIEVLLNGEISLSKALKLALPEENIDVLLSEELIEKLTTYFTLPRDNVVIGQISLRQLFELGLTQENIDTLSKDKIKCKVQPHYNWDDEIELVGIKWYSGKGYGHANKWLPTVMIPSTKIAVERLQSNSKEAREFAFMLENSSDFPRHRLCPDVPEDQLLTMNEVALALGLDLSVYETAKKLQTSRNQLLRRKGIEREDYVINLRDLNKIVRNDLPQGFPYILFKTGSGEANVKWSEALFSQFNNSFSPKSSILTELSIPTINTLNEDLAPTKKINKKNSEQASGQKSLFQRWGFGNLAITSHQLRHLIDTIAAINGMTEELRARWAARSDPRHNAYYDHTTPEEYGADFIEDREKELSNHARPDKTPIQVQIATPRTIQELNTKAALTAHTTEYGMCITSYLSEPCTKYRDCINCNDHVCTKGDDGKCERIRQRLKDEQKLLKKDKKAVDDGIPGALQWYEKRKLTTERCEQLLTMMEDPNIPDGSLIKLSNIEEVTLLDRAMDVHGKKRLPEIINYQRIKAVSTDELVEITHSSESSSNEDDLDDLDDLDD